MNQIVFGPSEDISAQAFGKYQHCTMHWGLWYADSDFRDGFGGSGLRYGSIPAPFSEDRRPWRGIAVELFRRMQGATRSK